MKQWMNRLIDQLSFDVSEEPGRPKPIRTNPSVNTSKVDLDSGTASLLHIMETYNKHLLEIESFPVRKVRLALDELVHQVLDPEVKDKDKVLFRLREFFNRYRLAEFTYVENTMADFRGIIWDFVEQLSDDIELEQAEDESIQGNLNQLREAVAAHSVDGLLSTSRQFIDSYVEFQNNKDDRRKKRIDNLNEKLGFVKEKLVEANLSMRLDHLTKAYNRKSFDEQLTQYHKYFQLKKTPVTLLSLDIDHFKAINDNYGHPMGDYVLQQLVKMLHELFAREKDFVARVGGEEFSIILPDFQVEHAVKKAELALKVVAAETFVQEDLRVNFTISIGIAELQENETIDSWMKRADEALYSSKTNGRNRLTVAENEIKSSVA